MKLSSFALLLAGAVSTFAAKPSPTFQWSASGITVPFFNPAGGLTHKLVAASGTKEGNVHQLHTIEVLYFSLTDPTVVVQKLTAAEATWDEVKGTLVGRGAIAVTTPETQLAGEGFDFTLTNSVVNIHRDFTLTNREVALSSDRAKVELVVEKAGDDVKVRDVKTCEAQGNLQVLVQPTATKEYPADRILSNVAIYDGASQSVTFPEAVRTFRGGRETLGSNKLRLDFKAPLPPAPVPAAPPN